MNPIYKFNLSINGVATQQAFPTYNDGLAINFDLQNGEKFFRANLSGEIIFSGPDFDRINTAAFDSRFSLVILISYNAGASWANYWTGTFYKTDCKFDEDTKTVVVTPTVQDRYNDILAGLDKEFNLIDLAPEIVEITADKRPMIQVYVPGDSVIACFLSGMWWEQDCEAVSSEQDLINHYYFALLKTQLVYTASGAVTTEIVPGTDGNYTFAIRSEQSPLGNYWRAELVRLADGATWDYETAVDAPEPTLPLTLSADATTWATGTVLMDSRTINIYGRYILDVDEILGLATYPIPDDDLVPDNRNYRRVIGYAVSNTIFFSSQLTSIPTNWGMYQPGLYYAPPINSNVEMFPVARSSWSIVSVWFAFASLDWFAESSGRKSFAIKDAFPLSSVISVLLKKIAPRITHAGTIVYSQFLYGINPITNINQQLFITPKSNIISSGYDQPAQKAPITLRDVLNMLRDCFRCYWYIDSSNRLRIEHIRYFSNGGSYAGTPVVGVDLTMQRVPGNGKAWAFAKNQYKFDKPAMAARYQFGWMDDVTQLFEGYPIDIVSGFVNPENVEQITIGRFTSDIDFVLLNPESVSKDGFILLSASKETLQIQWQLNKYYNSIAYLDATPYNYGAGQLNVVQYRGQSIHLTLSAIVGAYCFFVDENNNIIQRIEGNIDANFVIPQNAQYLLLSNYFDDVPNPVVYIDAYRTQYYQYGNYWLQNGYAAFVYLQQYYAWDMPAAYYAINGVTYMASGVKKLKKQDVRFPALIDPSINELIKTELGNGTIEKLSINLSSRNATATLSYDTE